MNPFLCLHLIWTHLVKKQNFTGRSCLLNNRFLHLRCCDRTVTANSELWPYVARITMPFMLPRKTILHKVKREEIEIILRNFMYQFSQFSIRKYQLCNLVQRMDCFATRSLTWIVWMKKIVLRRYYGYKRFYNSIYMKSE